MNKDIFAKGIIRAVIAASGFEISKENSTRSRPAVSVPYDDMAISDKSRAFFKINGISSLWRHQRIAIEEAITGNNVCVSTSTSSGKTEIFQTVAIEMLEKNPNAKVLAVYSAKALNSQQRSRWENTGYAIGQIDGDHTGIDYRKTILKDKRIVVITPDVMHAFLLGKLADERCANTIKEFIKNVELIIIDEIHLYRGVFGTNSAYLFRRFNNVRRLLRKDKSFPLYVTASATLPNPNLHSADITGVSPFINIGIEVDGSPMSETEFYYIQVDKNNKGGDTLLERVSKLSMLLTDYDNAKSITFVESRQRTGAIVLVQQSNAEEHKNNPSISDIEKELEAKHIYPYRAGMEEKARENILQKMEEGKFKGVISTSALEIGIDIKGLNVAIIANIPYNRNSYYQRIGRVGRGNSKKSYVLIVNDGSLKAQLLFDYYNFDIDRLLPDLKPALYLENKQVQYVHAACHADFNKDTCELNACQKDAFEDKTNKYFPNSFADICSRVSTMQQEKNYDEYVGKYDNPHLKFTLRNTGDNYVLVENENEIGESVNRIQLFREAYKGAIRNTTTELNGRIVTSNQEVIAVEKADRNIRVREYKGHATTKPIDNTSVYPNFNKDCRYNTISCGETVIFNLDISEVKTIFGYTKKTFKNEEKYNYPKPFADTVRTTGVVLFHPVLNKKGVERAKISNLIFEAFLMLNAFDRNDINYKSGRLRIPHPSENLKGNDYFLALYDINQLNITSNLMDKETLKNTFNHLQKYLETFITSLCPKGVNDATRYALETLCTCIVKNDFVNEECNDESNYMTVFAQESPADYQEQLNSDEENAEGDGFEKQRCQVLSVQKLPFEDTVEYIILLDGKPKFNVSQDSLSDVENHSSYAKFDWNNGQIVD